ncbi:MAG: DUF4147 domain-containing protein [Nannocystaceae bacterium]|nr:DUF4147 domain-containing protein [Nannocystaceae bacterium]
MPASTDIGLALRRTTLGAAAPAMAQELAAALGAALRACDPGAWIAQGVAFDRDAVRLGALVLPRVRGARVHVLAVGKAAPAMADALATALRHEPDATLWAVSKRDGASATKDARVVSRVASHPLPDGDSVAAAREALARAAACGPDDLLLVALSGGASSLLCAPAPGWTLATVRERIASLQRVGAPIEVLNRERAAIDRIKHGGLARACPGRPCALVLVDVAGDAATAAGVVGSGPLWLPERGVPHVVVADNRTAVEAAMARLALALPQGRVHQGVPLVGPAHVAGRALAAAALARRGEGPAAIVAGGETTTEIVGDGRGGRTLELALGAARVLAGRRGVSVTVFATDGDDGNSGAAGAIVDGTTLQRLAARGLDLDAALARSDSDALLSALGDRIVTGPTRTNVCDLAIAWIDAADASAP